MNKKLLSIGLAGLLGLSTNVSALETNVRGYEVPNKGRYELLGSVAMSGEITINFYKDTLTVSGKELVFDEVLVNGKPALYVFEDYILADENCDGKFETKYNIEEGLKRFGIDLEDIPKCYFDKK